MNVLQLKEQFKLIFHRKEDPRTFFAPGRINLIGEHIDYNGGHVFPAAISLGTYALVLKRNDKKLRFYSLNFPDKGIIECDISEPSYKKVDDWANYPKGIIHYVKSAGHEINQGMDIFYFGNIPNGAGLSSSASIELVTGVLINELFDLKIPMIELVKIGQKVENKYIGVNSGIMDQFAVGMGKKDHAILLDCNTLNFQYAPLKLKDHVVIIINTNKKRVLADSKYNERRAQCKQALKDLQSRLNIQSLCKLSVKEFENYKQLIKNPIHRKRTKHAVYENARTLKALNELINGNLMAFGKLMNASHRSLKDDYEVTGLELDTIVQAAWQQEGVLGARMTGAGFGGCAIAVVEDSKVDSFKQNINKIYFEKVGYNATFYSASISSGAKELK